MQSYRNFIESKEKDGDNLNSWNKNNGIEVQIVHRTERKIFKNE